MQDDTTQTTDASLSECGTERFERNHYFHGKLMTARDMQAEQAYNVGQRRAQARQVGGHGIATGLDADISTRGEDAIKIKVEAGYGVDECGRPVVVPELYDDTITDGSKVNAPALSVYLHYEACLKESVPVDGAETACEDECAYNRVLEVYDVEVAAGKPEQSAVSKSVEPVTFPGWNDLSDVSDADRSLPGRNDPIYATIAESYWDDAEAPGGAEAAERGLYLGSFETDEDGNWFRSEDRPRQHLYTNDMLYAGLARHTADFGNPHETSLRTVKRDSDYETGLQVRDDGSDNPQVIVSSTDESVDVIHTPDTQQVDLSVKSYVEKLVDERIEPLEQYAVERALKYKALVFERAADRFEGEAGGTAGDIASLAREAVDTRLATTAGTTEDGTVEIGGDDTEPVEAENYGDLLTAFLALEEEFRTQVDDQVTDDSYQRLSNAIGGLKAALEPAEPSTLDIGAAEDDVADAVEWLEQPEEEEEPEPEPADATFADGGQFAEHRGDIASMTVELENTRSATLRVGEENSGYHSTVDVQSGGGNAVTVQLNTFLAGRNAAEESRAYGTANPADSASATLESDEREEPLHADTFDLTLVLGGEETAKGTLELRERETEDLRVRRGPAGSYDKLVTPGEIQSAAGEGTLTDGDVESGDAVVARIAATGIYGAIAAASGDATAVDGRAVEQLGYDELCWIDISQSGLRTAAGKQIDLWKSVNRDAARVLADPESDRLYVVLDTARAVVLGSGNDRASLRPAEEYAVEFNVAGNSSLASEPEQVSDTFKMAGRKQVQVPELVGDTYTEASMKVEERQLSLDPTYRQIETANTLQRVTYDTIKSQTPDAGNSLPAGSVIEVEVWTSRPIDTIEGIDQQYVDQLKQMDIEYVHQLENVDTAQLTGNLSGVGTQTATNWKNLATDYRIAEELAIREGTDMQTALNVSSAFRESGQTEVRNLDTETMQTLISGAAQDTQSQITAEGAQTFLENSQNLRTTFETVDTQFDDTMF